MPSAGNPEKEYEYGGPPPTDIPPSPVSGLTPSAAAPESTEPSATTPMSPPVPPEPPAPPHRRNQWIAVGAVVVVVIVVVAVLAFTLTGGPGTGGGGIPLGTPATYGQTVPIASSEGQLASGSPWTIVAAEGLYLPSGISGPDFNVFGGSGCTYTPAPGSPGTIVLPGTPTNATPGAVATWMFFAKNTALNTILLIEVSNGVAAPLVTATGSACVATFTDLGTITATSAVDSSAVAASLNAGGGTAFLQSHPGAVELFVLLGSSAADAGEPVWSVSYTTCAFAASSGTGSEITALFNATSGDAFSGPTSQSESC
jgi:hypothetical protein